MKGTIEGSAATKYTYAPRGTSVSHASHVNVGSSLQKPRGVSESLSTHDSSSGGGAYYSGSNDDDDEDDDDYGDENDEAFEDQQSYTSGYHKSQSSGPLSVLGTENQGPNKHNNNNNNNNNKRSSYWFSDMVQKSIFGEDKPRKQQSNTATLDYYSTEELRRPRRDNGSSPSTLASKPRRKSVIVRQLEKEEELDKRDQAQQLSQRIQTIKSQLEQNKEGNRTSQATRDTRSSVKENDEFKSTPSSRSTRNEEDTWDYNLKDHRTTSWNYFYPSGIADLTTPQPPKRTTYPTLSKNDTKQSFSSERRPSRGTPQSQVIIQHSPTEQPDVNDALSYSDESDDSVSDCISYDMGSEGEDSLDAASTHPRSRRSASDTDRETNVVVRVPLSSNKQSASTPATVFSDQSLARHSHQLNQQPKDVETERVPANKKGGRGNLLSSAWNAAKRTTRRKTNAQSEEIIFGQKDSKVKSSLADSPEHASHKSSEDLGKESFQSAVSEIRRQLSRDTIASGRVNESRSIYSGSTLTSRDTLDCAMSFSSRPQGSSGVEGESSFHNGVNSSQTIESNFSTPNRSLRNQKHDKSSTHPRMSPKIESRLSFQQLPKSEKNKARNFFVQHKKSITGYYENVYNTRSWPLDRQKPSLKEFPRIPVGCNSPSEGRTLPVSTKPKDEQQIKNSPSNKSPAIQSGAPTHSMSKPSLYGGMEVLSSQESGDLSLEVKPTKFTRSRISSPKRPALKCPKKAHINEENMLRNDRYSKPTPKEGSRPLHPLIRIISAGGNKDSKSPKDRWKSSEKIPSNHKEEDEIVFGTNNETSEKSPVKSPIYNALDGAKEKHSLWNNPGLWDTMQEDDLDEDIALGYPPNLGKYMIDYEDQNAVANKSTFGSSYFCSRSNRDVTEEIRAQSSPVENSHNQTEDRMDDKGPPGPTVMDLKIKPKTILGSLTCSGPSSADSVEPRGPVPHDQNEGSTRPEQCSKCDQIQPEAKGDAEENPSNDAPIDLDESLDSDMGPFERKVQSEVSVQKFTFAGYTNSSVGSSIDDVSMTIKRKEVTYNAKSQPDSSPKIFEAKSSHDRSLPGNPTESFHSRGSKSNSSAPMFYCGNKNDIADSKEDIAHIDEESVDQGASRSEEDADQPDEGVILDSDTSQTSWTPKIQKLIAQATGIKAEIKKELERDSILPSSSHDALSLQSTPKAKGSSQSNLEAPNSCHSKKVAFVSAQEVQCSHTILHQPSNEAAQKPIKSILSNKSECIESQRNCGDELAKHKTQRDNLHVSTSLYSNDSSTVYGPCPLKTPATSRSGSHVSASKSLDSSTVYGPSSLNENMSSLSGLNVSASKSADDSSTVYGRSAQKLTVPVSACSDSKENDFSDVEAKVPSTKSIDERNNIAAQPLSTNKHLPLRIGIFGRRKVFSKDNSQTLAKKDSNENKLKVETIRPKMINNDGTYHEPKRLQGRVRKLLNRFTPKKKTAGKLPPKRFDNQNQEKSKNLEFSSTASDKTADAVGPIDSESVFHNIEINTTPSQEIPFERKSTRIGIAECDPILDEYSQNGDFDENQLSPQSREIYLAEEQLAQQLAKDLELLTRLHKMKQDRKGQAQSSSVAKAASTIKNVQRLILRQHETLKHKTHANDEDNKSRSISSETYDEDEVATEISDNGFVSDEIDEVQNATFTNLRNEEERKNQSWGTHYDLCGSSNQVHDDNAIN